MSFLAEAVETERSAVSPESSICWQACWPLTPPAALISETARPTPAISGGPRKARLPVSGRMPPTLKWSALVAAASHSSLVNAGASDDSDCDGEDSDVGLSPASGLSPPSSPHAARVSAKAAVPAISLTQDV